MNILVLSSTQIEDSEAIRKFAERVEISKDLVISAPAMGQTAEQLKKAAEKSALQDLVVASALAEGLRTYHMQVAQQLTSEENWRETRSQLGALFEELTSLLNGLYLLGELSDKGRRMASSYGERAGAMILGGALAQRHISNQVFSSRELFLAPSRSALDQEIEAAGRAGKIPIVPGSLLSHSG